MKILVITGGIGSGKSLVSRRLEEKYGIPVYDADSRVKALYAEVPQMLDAIETELGVRVRDEKGNFVPKMLADVIFSDNQALLKVEEIIFPYLKNDFSNWADFHGKEIVAFESATILEKPQFDDFGDIVLLVDAPKSLRLSRACARDGQEEGKILERMAAQKLMNSLSEGSCCERVDHTIINDSDQDDLYVKIEDFIEKYRLTKMLSI